MSQNREVQAAYAALAHMRNEAQYRHEHLGEVTLAEYMFKWADTLEAALTALQAQVREGTTTRKRAWRV